MRRSHIHLLFALLLTLLLINPAITAEVKRAPALSASTPAASSAPSSAATSSDSLAASSSAPGSSVPATGAASGSSTTVPALGTTSGATATSAASAAAATSGPALTGATTINGTPMGPAGCTPTDTAAPVVGQLIPVVSNPCTPVVSSGGGDTSEVTEAPPAQPSIELPPLPNEGELIRVGMGMLVGMVGAGMGLVGWQIVF